MLLSYSVNKYYLAILMVMSTMCSYGQNSTSTSDMTNSCSTYLKGKFPSLSYSYNTSSQTHNYSNNWDFDGDGKVDSLYFISNGGAHLYFSLKIVLSSETKARDYSFILLDLPCLDDTTTLIANGNKVDAYLPQFVVHDFDSNGTEDIYVNIGSDYNSLIPKKWKAKGVTSPHILLKYRSKDIVIENFKKN